MFGMGTGVASSLEPPETLLESSGYRRVELELRTQNVGHRIKKRLIDRKLNSLEG